MVFPGCCSESRLEARVAMPADWGTHPLPTFRTAYTDLRLARRHLCQRSSAQNILNKIVFGWVGHCQSSKSYSHRVPC